MTRVDSPGEASVDEPIEVVATVVPVIPVTVDDDAIDDASRSTATAVLTDDTDAGEDEETSGVPSTSVVAEGAQVDTIEPVGDTDSGIDSLIQETLRADDRETCTLVKGDGCKDEDVDEKGEILALVVSVTGALTGTLEPNLPDSA